MGVVEVEPRIKAYADYFGAFSRAGYCARVKDSVDLKLANTWDSMMRRCYDPKAVNYARYAGISVCERWQNLPTFIADVRLLPGWQEKKADWATYQLDKDYYSSNQYSPDTCVWLSLKENHAYMHNVKPVRVTNPYGKVAIYLSARQAGAALGVAGVSITRSCVGVVKPSRKLLGFKMEFCNTKHPLRRALCQAI